MPIEGSGRGNEGDHAGTDARQGVVPVGSLHRRAAVFGGGPGGLTAAHELAERGFEVTLYERHAELGGKCRSFTVPDTGRAGRADLPGEVGPHAVLGAYQNLGQTLRRIPVGEGRSVLDRLVPGRTLQLVWAGAKTTVPISWNALRGSRIDVASLAAEVLGGIRIARRLGVRDTAQFASKCIALLTSGRLRQWEQLEDMSVEEYYRVDRFGSGGRQWMPVYLQGAPAAADRVSARALVIGSAANVVLGPMVHRFGPGFDALAYLTDAPMNEALFDPWATHLRSLGVRIHTRHRLTEVACENGRISGATVRDPDGRDRTVDADWYVLAVPADKAAQLMTPQLTACDPALARIAHIDHTWLGCMQIYLKHPAPELKSVTFLCGQPWTIACVTPTDGLWQGRFADRYGDGTVTSLLSVDVASWDIPGIVYGKPARRCRGPELFEEIRAQIRAEFDDPTLLPDTDIHSWTLNPALSFTDSGEIVHDEPGFNTAPGGWRNRPNAITAIDNLFLAASYVRTSTGIDSMDGANEAGKLAANAILAATRSNQHPAPIETPIPTPLLARLWAYDDRRYRRGQPNVFDLIAPSRRHY